MLVIQLEFPAGRYHATGWGRHVNEGVPEWPPSPYRILRALIDAWKRKRPEWSESRVEQLLAPLAAAPCFRLPQASTSHTRSFLSKNEMTATDRTLIFDAFVSIDRRDPVLAGWPEVTLNDQQAADLDELLSLMNYLGRSESWVSARVLTGVTAIDWNCTPWVEGDDRGEIAQVATPRSPGDVPGGSWLDALACSTGALLRSRRSSPPAMGFTNYSLPEGCLRVSPVARRSRRPERIQCVLYAFDCKVLPMVTATLEIAEQVRSRLMGAHKNLAGGPEHVSRKFSGKDPQGRPLNGHRHAYILPVDIDHGGDGRLDHMLIACQEPFDEIETRALDRLQSLYQSEGRPEIHCVPVKWGTLEDLFPAANRFVSSTPFIPPRHHRRGRGPIGEWVAGELTRECGNRCIEAPVRVKAIDRTRSNGHSFRWTEFRRNRRDDLVRPGYGFEIEFSGNVTGPIALGYGCHFGLGQFRPA